jgi:hypothetical protein
MLGRIHSRLFDSRFKRACFLTLAFITIGWFFLPLKWAFVFANIVELLPLVAMPDYVKASPQYQSVFCIGICWVLFILVYVFYVTGGTL